MKVSKLSISIFSLLIWQVICAPPDFNFDFSGFRQLTQLLVTSCNDIEGQIRSHIGGIQKPSHQGSHITCIPDDNVQNRFKFTIHRDEDDDAITGEPTKQRLEMYTAGRGDLHAYHGETFIYAWWFNLNSQTVATTSYWHIFQIKSSGASVDTNPTLTFTLKSNLGFHIEFFEDHHGQTQNIEMLPLKEAIGKWIQVFVKINYKESGYAEIYLKDRSGTELYHHRINGNFWWDGAEYYGPKWGLYRRRSDVFNPTDFINFQNVQIWKQ